MFLVLFPLICVYARYFIIINSFIKFIYYHYYILNIKKVKAIAKICYIIFKIIFTVIFVLTIFLIIFFNIESALETLLALIHLLYKTCNNTNLNYAFSGGFNDLTISGTWDRFAENFNLMDNSSTQSGSSGDYGGSDDGPGGKNGVYRLGTGANGTLTQAEKDHNNAIYRYLEAWTKSWYKKGGSEGERSAAA